MTGAKLALISALVLSLLGILSWRLYDLTAGGSEGKINSSVHSEDAGSEILEALENEAAVGSTDPDLPIAPAFGSGMAYEQFETVEERIEQADIVAEVVITEIGPLRYRTLDGSEPEDPADGYYDEAWIATHPVTMSVKTIYKTEVANVSTIISYRWPKRDPDRYSISFVEPIELEVGALGIAMVSEFYGKRHDPEFGNLTSDFLDSLAQSLPEDQQPYYIGAIHDFLELSETGDYRGGRFADENFSSDALIQRIQNYTSP